MCRGACARGVQTKPVCRMSSWLIPEGLPLNMQIGFRNKHIKSIKRRLVYIYRFPLLSQTANQASSSSSFCGAVCGPGWGLSCWIWEIDCLIPILWVQFSFSSGICFMLIRRSRSAMLIIYITPGRKFIYLRFCSGSTLC